MIADFMGHASLDMRLKRYEHFTDQTRREAIQKFDQGYTNGHRKMVTPQRESNPGFRRESPSS